MRGIRIIAAMVINDYRRMQKCMVVTTPPNKQKRTSNKSKLKQTKSKPSTKYKSSKPMQSKSSIQFRSRSNI